MLNNGEQYKTGYDFYNDLLSTYGKMQALEIANNYLDTQSIVYGNSTRFYNEDPEEYIFCCELFKATRKA